jgi:hypothetical protein
VPKYHTLLPLVSIEGLSPLFGVQIDVGCSGTIAGDRILSANERPSY